MPSPLTAQQVRELFVEFFEQSDHTQIASASLIPHDDTLLFVNSGMVPFKPYFLGESKPEHNRAVTVQKCVRAGGKHNDLDEVGRTSRHLTFFEMMGNFSFGDYFKEQAIEFAWEFVTQKLGLDPERLWVTVHLSDDEAAAIWAEKVGIPPERIQRLDEDNWWRMADTGPNGPCSEIFWDKGPEYGEGGGPAYGAEDRFIEIWNLVFMQFETDEAGESTPLPSPSIDTGAGLERIVSVLQGKDSVFEIDEMADLIASAEEVTGYKLGTSDDSDLALRVLAEHARTMVFLISDGVLPSNEDRGYVLRRIMRRAIRFAYLLGVEDVVTPSLVDAAVRIMSPSYPELNDSHELVRSVVEREEVQFRKTLASGSKILAEKMDEMGESKVLSGDVAFMLHDTYGFPVEVTAEVLAENDKTVDMDGFAAAMTQQREKSKSARKVAQAADDAALVAELVEAGVQTDFVGRETLVDVQGEVQLVSGPDSQGRFSVVVDMTPFYAESGGQVGDTGTIDAANASLQVVDTVYAAPGIVRHLVSHDGDSLGISVGDKVTLSIDVERRDSIRRNHTGTHILHWALRKVVGDHVQQQGSWVGPDRLRFDFSHFEALTAEQIVEIENLVNSTVLENVGTSHVEVSKSEAEEMGAIAFFGDKYGERVKVLTAGPSLEFCGGTHVNALGDIGCMKVTSEGSIGSNLRRIEAVTGTGTIELIRSSNAMVEMLAEKLKVAPANLETGLDKQVGEMAQLKAELKQLNSKLISGLANELVAEAQNSKLVKRLDGYERNDLGDLAKELVGSKGLNAVVIAGEPSGGGACLIAAVSADSDLHAGELIADGSKAISGGGGKGKDFAMAGGKNPDGVPEALDLAAKLLS